MDSSSSARKSSSLAQELENWYWNHGSLRQGRFQLPTGGWVRELREIQIGFEEVLPSLAQERPAAAIWGPSQTGKSTSVASYIDENAAYSGDPESDGSGSALHWPGGAPAYFVHPSLTKGAPGDLTRIVLNPYNSGLDASACLSRFVMGSLDGKDPKAFKLPDPRYSIGIQWVRRYDLWMSLARGYNSQCWGPKPEKERDETGRPVPRYQAVWTQDSLLACFKKHAARPIDSEARLNRAAYSRIHLLCRLIKDLVFAGLPRYRQLSANNQSASKISEWALSQYVQGTDQPNALLYSEEAAEAFAAEVLWDGYRIVTDYALALEKRLEELRRSFADKPVFCTIEVASLFLDMETFKIYLTQPSQKPKAKELSCRERLQTLRWEDKGDYIAIACDPSLSNPLLQGKEDFGVVQGLVWELVIALNTEHLGDNAFRAFIEESDLLDFPGVERGGKESPADKIDLDTLAERKRAGRYISEPNDEGDDPFQFFCKLLKRGKTSSIVCTYAQRLNIDIFSIFQDIDKDKPNGDELITGINTWWQANAPDYFRNQSGRSPLPLNYVLLWWSEFFEARHEFSNISKKLDPVGQISNPDVSTAFAMNYYYIPKRGEMSEATRANVGDQVAFLKAENAFARQFLSNPTSAASFEAMLEDTKTGGAEYFFKILARQARAVAESADSAPRLRTIAKRISDQQARLGTLLKTTDLAPEFREKDTRREQLLEVRARVNEATENATAEEIEAIEAAFRFLLDVDDRSLRPLGPASAPLTFETILDQTQSWIRAQSGKSLDAFPAEAAEGLKRVGLVDRESRAAFLQALAASVEPELKDLTGWFSDLVQHQMAGDSRVDFRRYLAVALSNLFSRIRSDDPFAEFDEEPETMDALLDETEPAAEWNLRGRDVPRYHVFLKPLVGENGVLASLADRNVIPITRPDQAGDQELVAILEANGVHP